MSFDITSPQEIKELKEAKFDSRNHWKRVGSTKTYGTGGFLSIFQQNSPLEIFAQSWKFQDPKLLRKMTRLKVGKGKHVETKTTKKDPGFAVRHVFSKDVMNPKLQVIGFLAG